MDDPITTVALDTDVLRVFPIVRCMLLLLFSYIYYIMEKAGERKVDW